MTQSPVDRAFRASDAFAPRESGREEGTAEYAAESTPFDAVASAEEADGDWRFSVTVRMPTLPAAVEGEVGDAVADGWFETLELRLEDAYDLVRSDRTEAPNVERDLAAGRVEAAFAFLASDPRQGVDDAAAVVDFVEGTYVQGVIPGYEYRDPVAGLIERAKRAGGTDGSPH